MTKLRAVDVHGFGGGFTLGAAQAGFDIIAKKSRGTGFGVLNCLANRHIIPGGWDVQSEEPYLWTVDEDVDYVFGNPPCSGFSTLTSSKYRGQDAKVNDYMWEFVRHAAKLAPKIAVFESVQQTFTQGRELLSALLDTLIEESGYNYRLYHVLHNNASLGGGSNRRRYYWTAVRADIAFGVEKNPTRSVWGGAEWTTEEYELESVPTLNDVIRDLETLPLTMSRQEYMTKLTGTGRFAGVDRGQPGALSGYEWAELSQVLNDPETHREMTRDYNRAVILNSSQWAREHAHDGTGSVDGHDIARTPTYDRVAELLAQEVWHEGERMADVMRRHYERTGKLTESWNYDTKVYEYDENGKNVLDEHGKKSYILVPKVQRIIESDFAMGVNQPVRWRGDQMAKVLTGGGVHLVVHPREPRTLTHREAARIQGFPDHWRIFPNRYTTDLTPGWGKGVPVQTGRWISLWAKNSIEGNPGAITGKEDGDEFVIDVTNEYKKVLA